MAFRHGMRARVSTRRAHRMREGLLAMDTRTRMASSSRACQAIHALFQGIDLDCVPWMFKKVDSVLRGHVRLEIESILSLTGLQRALLIPANPSKGRGPCSTRPLHPCRPIRRHRPTDHPGGREDPRRVERLRSPGIRRPRSRGDHRPGAACTTLGHMPHPISTGLSRLALVTARLYSCSPVQSNLFLPEK